MGRIACHGHQATAEGRVKEKGMREVHSTSCDMVSYKKIGIAVDITSSFEATVYVSGLTTAHVRHTVSRPLRVHTRLLLILSAHVYVSHFTQLLAGFSLYNPILSPVTIKLPIKVTINLVLKLTISSGTSQIVAPIFLAIDIASLALAYFSSSVRP